MNGEIKINDFSLLNDQDKLKIMINADKDKNSTKIEYCLQVFFKSQYMAIFDLLNISISKFNKNNKLLDYIGNSLKNSYIGISQNLFKIFISYNNKIFIKLKILDEKTQKKISKIKPWMLKNSYIN